MENTEPKNSLFERKNLSFERMKIMETKEKSIKGLRSNKTDIEPKHDCPNCKCKRYSPCYCERKK